MTLEIIIRPERVERILITVETLGEGIDGGWVMRCQQGAALLNRQALAALASDDPLLQRERALEEQPSVASLAAERKPERTLGSLLEVLVGEKGSHAERNRPPPRVRKAWLRLLRRRQRSMFAWVNKSQSSSAK